MSVKVVGTKITMTRGDTLLLQVNIFQDDNEEYVCQPGDSVRFAARPAGLNAAKTEYANNIVIDKPIPTDSLMLQLEPADTKQLPFGKYVYDIELTKADGTVDTFITEATLILSPEVK